MILSSWGSHGQVEWERYFSISIKNCIGIWRVPRSRQFVEIREQRSSQIGKFSLNFSLKIGGNWDCPHYPQSYTTRKHWKSQFCQIFSLKSWGQMVFTSRSQRIFLCALTWSQSGPIFGGIMDLLGNLAHGWVRDSKRFLCRMDFFLNFCPLLV